MTTAVNIITTFIHNIEFVTNTVNLIRTLSENILMQTQQSMNELNYLESIASESKRTFQVTFL